MSENNDGVTSRVEAVMARIRAGLPGTRNEGNSATRPIPAPDGEASIFGAEVYRNLYQARTIGGGSGVYYELGWRTPVVGQVWMLVRQRIHQEIRIYFDLLTTRQATMNAHVLRALTGVVEGVDSLGLRAMIRNQQEQADAVQALREEVAQLRLELQSHRADRGTSASEPRLNGDPTSRV